MLRHSFLLLLIGLLVAGCCSPTEPTEAHTYTLSVSCIIGAASNTFTGQSKEPVEGKWSFRGVSSWIAEDSTVAVYTVREIPVTAEGTSWVTPRGTLVQTSDSTWAGSGPTWCDWFDLPWTATSALLVRE